jgi:hypothetical protein
MHKTARRKLATLKPGLKTPPDRLALHSLKKKHVSEMGSVPARLPALGRMKSNET